MKLCKKDELESIVGKSSFWAPKKLVGLCEYVAGIDEIDEKLGSQNYLKVKPLVNFNLHSDGLEISVMHNFKLYYIGLRVSNMNSIVLERGSVIDIENRSVIGRAVAGGLLLGPIGALIGGMSGFKDKVIKENDSIIILINNEGKEQALLFEIKKGKTKDIASYFKENYSAIFCINY